MKDAKDEEIAKSHTNSSNQVLINEETKTKETINEDASNMVVLVSVYSSERRNLKSQSNCKIIPKTKYVDNSEDAIMSADDVRILDDYKNNELEENYYEEDMIHDNQSDTYL